MRRKCMLQKGKLLALADFLEKNHPNLNMLDWVRFGKLDDNEYLSLEDFDKKESCNTACCIGGWAVLLEGHKINCLGAFADAHSNSGQYLGSVESVAAQILGLPEHDLFFVSDWPVEFQKEYDRETTNRAALAAKVIRHY